MEPRSVEELMDLLYACHGTRVVAGLVQPVGALLWPGDPAGRADRAADAVRALPGGGPWFFRAWGGPPASPLRTVLDLPAAANSRLGAVD